MNQRCLWNRQEFTSGATLVNNDYGSSVKECQLVPNETYQGTTWGEFV